MTNHLLSEARKNRGYSQEELASIVGVNRVTLNRWEQGKLPYPFHRRKLCSLFELTEQELGFVPSSLIEENQASAPFDSLIPVPPNLSLVGREKELVQLKSRLMGGNNMITALNGLPGVGKTALSITLAHDPEIRAYFRDGILWAGLGPEPNLQGHLSRWATLLGISSGEMSGLNGTEAWAVALRRTIGTRTMLLVIDDAWNQEAVLTLKIGGPNCAHLVSTRFPAIATQIAAEGTMVIKELNCEDGMVLLRMLAPLVAEKEFEGALRLVQTVGGLPLALTLIGNYLRTQSYAGQERRMATALQKLTDAGERLNVSEQLGPVDRHPSLQTKTLNLRTIIDVTVQQMDNQAQAALLALAVFPPKPNTFGEEAALTVATCTVETLDQLTDTGLLETSGSDRYSLHQTIADYARLQLSPKKLQQIAQAHAHYYLQQSEIAHQFPQKLLDQENRNLLAGLEWFLANAQEPPEEALRMITNLAKYFEMRGRNKEGFAYIMRALFLSKQGDPAHLTEDLIASNIASNYIQGAKFAAILGDLNKAETLSLEALTFCQKRSASPISAKARLQIGLVYAFRHNFPHAEEYLRQGIAILQGDPVESITSDYGQALMILGHVLSVSGKDIEARNLLEEGLKIYQRNQDVMGEARAGLHLATHEFYQNHLEDALARNQACWQFIEKITYPMNKAYLGIWQVAYLLADGSVDVKKMEELLAQSQSIFEQLGNRQGIAFLLLNRAKVRLAQQNTSAAEQDYHQSLQITATTKDFYFAASALEGLAEIETRPEQAVCELSEAMALHKALHIELQPIYQTARARLLQRFQSIYPHLEENPFWLKGQQLAMLRLT